MLTMQHLLGLKDATDPALKLNPKQLARLDVLKKAEPVFVCIDLEAFEFAQNKITEVGVSILDTRSLLDTDPGSDGSAWLAKINTHHIIIDEHKKLVNKRFVHGCPDKFNFGQSQYIKLKDIHKTLTNLFANPSPQTSLESDQGSRKLILVGHGLSNDTTFMKALQFAPNAKGHVLQEIDTQKIAGSKKNTVGLSRMMRGLGIETSNLHNAGNDAAYTLQGLVLLAVQHTNNPGQFLKAIANAKPPPDPAKQRYKEHKARLRDQKKKKSEVRVNVQAAEATDTAKTTAAEHIVDVKIRKVATRDV